jgi:hypothetical protein
MPKSLVIQNHDQAGHFALDHTCARIMNSYYFPKMKCYVRQHISMCIPCAVSKVPRDPGPGFLHPIEPGKRPFETVHVDHLGPFTTSERGNSFIFVLIDDLTKFVKMYAVKNTSTAGVIASLDKLHDQYGLMKRLISDRGRHSRRVAFGGIVSNLVSSTM